MANLVAVAKVSEVPPGDMKEIKQDGLRFVIANVDGQFYAFGWECLHTRGAPLAEGWLQDFEVECPWHGGRYDIRSGEPTAFPACENIPVYKVQVDGEDIKVELP